MNKLTLSSLALAASLGSFSITANAESCTWGLSSFTISSTNQTYTNVFACQNNGATLATKTVVVRAKVAPSCTVTINNSLYSNLGTCNTPDIQSNTNPAPGSKVCEFNDPSTGTTPGCTQNGIGGGGGTIAYQVSKNGQPLLVVSKTTGQNNWCTLAGENTNYRASGDCNNYRVYAK
ncbi:MAG: hypothetical protein NVV73_19130 [Cellvibrionaceae bacterium]|nr:hypothetical protein [Cellvibrionaceae bacterium]